MRRPNNPKGSLELQNLPISTLVEVLVDACKLDDIDEALQVEKLICKKIDESTVEEVGLLLTSEERYCNVAALRILSDSGRVRLDKVYGYIDQLFERGDIAVSGLCLRLIQQYDYKVPRAMSRMAQFINSSNDSIKEIVRVWLLWRTPDELSEFLEKYQPFDENTSDLINLIYRFRKDLITIDVFFDELSKTDAVAFREFTRLKTEMPRFSRPVFYP